MRCLSFRSFFLNIFSFTSRSDVGDSVTEERSVAYIHADVNEDNYENKNENEILGIVGKNALSLSSQELRVRLFDKYWTCLIDREALLMKSFAKKQEQSHTKSCHRPFSVTIDTYNSCVRKFSSRYVMLCYAMISFIVEFNSLLLCSCLIYEQF